jgi:Sec7-like guanine-nucleotide exchange factor
VIGALAVVLCSDLAVCTINQGIRFLIDSGLLKNTSNDIAQFLYKGEGLNKTAIGDYLGER